MGGCMSPQSRILLAGGFVCLLLGLLLPWVHLAPDAVKHQHMTELGTLLKQPEALPKFAQDFLHEHGWQNYQSVPELKIFFTQNLGLGNTFSQLYSRSWLFSWDFFRLDVANGTRFLIGVLLMLCIVSGVVVVYLWQQGAVSLVDEDEFAYLDDDEFEASSQSGLGGVLAGIALVAFLSFFFFIIQLPLLDSLGHQGERALSFFALIVEARVTIVPRLFVPVGLLLFILAGIEDVVAFTASRKGTPSFAEEFD